MTYDAIVVGGGHNGLTAAAYLARAGRRVLVLEGREIVGGYCTTEETVAEAPGFKMNPCALDCLMTSIPRSIVDDLELARYGLRFVEPEPWGCYLGPDGESIGLWRDRARTVGEIARFSRGDAERFERFCTIMKDFWWAAAPYLQDHPLRPRARTIGEVVWRALKARRSLRPMARMLLASPEQLLEEWFDREEVKAFLANLAIVSYLPLQEPGSGAVLGATSLYLEWGAFRPVGGSGAFTSAIADCVRAHGGEIRTGARVGQIVVRGDGVAQGVELEGGERLHARQVIGAVDPRTLIDGMVPDDHVPDALRRELRGHGVLRWNISTLKSDVALSGRTPLACGRQELLNGFLLLGPTMDHMRRAQASCIAGDVPEQIPMWVAMPSVVDRSQVPPGSDAETLYVYTCTVPRELRDGSSWETRKEAVHDRCLDIVETYAPGIKDTVIGASVKGPDDYARLSTRGHVIHSDVSMSQMGPWRPTPSMAGYRTPSPGCGTRRPAAIRSACSTAGAAGPWPAMSSARSSGSETQAPEPAQREPAGRVQPRERRPRRRDISRGANATDATSCSVRNPRNDPRNVEAPTGCLRAALLKNFGRVARRCAGKLARRPDRKRTTP